MSRATARRGLSALLALACAAAVLLVALDRPAPSRAPAFALAADGALALQNDRAGAAILSAAGLRPGGGTEGTVTLAATTDAALHLRLELGAATPGTGGGQLADRLRLAIDDVTDPAQPIAVYAGRLTELAPHALGGVRAGAERRYRFRASFPSGTDDDAFQGASLTAAFVWTAVAAAGPAVPQPPAPAPAPEPPPQRPAGPATQPAAAAARVTGLPSSGRCVKRRRYAIAAKPRAGVRVRSLRLVVGGKRVGSARRAARATLDLTRSARTRVTVRVVVETTAGTVTVRRTLRLCR